MRPRALHLASYLVLASACVAQAQAVVDRVEGAVTDPFGAPVEADATLRSISGYLEETATNRDGRFVFESVVPGIYTLTVSTKGFSASTQEITARNASLNIPITLVRDRPAMVVVTTTNPQGLALPGVVVSLEGPDGKSLEGVTDGGGVYTTGSVRPGRWLVEARLPGFQDGSTEVSAFYGPPAQAVVSLGLDYEVSEDLVVLGATRPVGRRTDVRAMDSPVTTAVVRGESRRAAMRHYYTSRTTTNAATPVTRAVVASVVLIPHGTRNRTQPDDTRDGHGDDQRSKASEETRSADHHVRQRRNGIARRGSAARQRGVGSAQGSRPQNRLHRAGDTDHHPHGDGDRTRQRGRRQRRPRPRLQPEDRGPRRERTRDRERNPGDRERSADGADAPPDGRAAAGLQAAAGGPAGAGRDGPVLVERRGCRGDRGAGEPLRPRAQQRAASRDAAHQRVRRAHRVPTAPPGEPENARKTAADRARTRWYDDGRPHPKRRGGRAGINHSIGCRP